MERKEFFFQETNINPSEKSGVWVCFPLGHVPSPGLVIIPDVWGVINSKARVKTESVRGKGTDASYKRQNQLEKGKTYSPRKSKG